ncbi:mannitol dehydrogenase family protein [Roseinatronobacter alkalisoli]|uniref:Mannitol dehydrogenase family protein n=1 Tax=Roseinatronobacter alkalisoli TaxID=3028235 RepID=A0ABT5TA85_9RHOB|nr:mannitol dehydrogenase family protein [Roseinatronobacter sp. HJB301]MDD7972025.1 mannitol dehydrogenase family protein [Roseinatronobacter sp. HJB301]
MTWPKYDRHALTAGVVHLGVGNFHRAHMGVYFDRLAASGHTDWAILGAGIMPGDAQMRDRLLAQDCLTTVVDLDAGALTARVTGAMIDFLPVVPAAIIAAMSDPAIRIVTLSVTEGGYFLDSSRRFDTQRAEVQHDASNPNDPQTVFGIILAALRARRAAGHSPFTILSCDNLLGNGEVVRAAVTGLAALSDPGFAEWIRQNVSFPNAMVDCITPATTERERARVRDHFGIDDSVPVVCEPFRQWVIEDHFPAGRPPLEKVGVEFVEDITLHELMKLRLLNASHVSMAAASMLLGHEFVHAAMADPLVQRWLEALQTREIIPTLPGGTGTVYSDYLGSVFTRFANPAVGDTIARLAADSTERQENFILPILRDALSAGPQHDGLCLEIALWARFLEGKDEAGRVMTIEDTRRPVTAPDMQHPAPDTPAVLASIGADPIIADKVTYWRSMLAEQGVRRTLSHYIDRDVS